MFLIFLDLVSILVNEEQLLHGACFSMTFVLAVDGRPVDAFVWASSHHWTRYFGFDSKTDKLEYNLFLYIVGFSSSTWIIGRASGVGAAISCDS